MFPTELDFEMRRQQMERDAAHDRLIRLAQEDQPGLWERLWIRLSAAHVAPAAVAPTTVICEKVTRRDVIVVNQ